MTFLLAEQILIVGGLVSLVLVFPAFVLETEVTGFFLFFVGIALFAVALILGIIVHPDQFIGDFT